MNMDSRHSSVFEEFNILLPAGVIRRDLGFQIRPKDHSKSFSLTVNSSIDRTLFLIKLHITIELLQTYKLYMLFLGYKRVTFYY